MVSRTIVRRDIPRIEILYLDRKENDREGASGGEGKGAAKGTGVGKGIGKGEGGGRGEGADAGTLASCNSNGEG